MNILILACLLGFSPAPASWVDTTEARLKIGDTRPAGDGCNTCTYQGGDIWSCTLMLCVDSATSNAPYPIAVFPPTVEELQAKIEALEKRVGELEKARASFTITPEEMGPYWMQGKRVVFLDDNGLEANK